MPFPDHIVEVQLPRAALRECFRDAEADGTVSLPGVYDFPLGANVCVRMGLEGLPAGAFFDTVVLSRWPGVGATRAGIGLRALPASLDAVRFLSAWAQGKREGAGRREWRYPVDVPVILVTAPRGSTRIYPCTLADVSHSGARAVISHRIEPGAELRCEWRGDFGIGSVSARAVWAVNGRLGIELQPQKPDEKVEWDRFVSAVRATLRSRVVAPMPDKSWSASGNAVRAERGFTPSPTRSTGPVEIHRSTQPKLVEIAGADASTRTGRRDPRSE